MAYCSLQLVFEEVFGLLPLRVPVVLREVGRAGPRLAAEAAEPVRVRAVNLKVSHHLV